MTKLINLNYDRKKSKTKIVTKPKKMSCNKTQNPELEQNSTQSLTTFKNANSDKIKQPNCDKTQQLKF